MSNDHVCSQHVDIDYLLLDIGCSPFPLYLLNASPACGRSFFTEFFFTGRILGHVFLKGIAPQGLKCAATAVQGVHLGEVRVLAAQVAPLDAVGGYPGVILLPCAIVSHFHVCTDFLPIYRYKIRFPGVE